MSITRGSGEPSRGRRGAMSIVDRPTGFKHRKKGHCPRTFPVAGLGDSDTMFELTHSPSIQCWAVVVIKDPLSHGGQRACVFSRGASYLR